MYRQLARAGWRRYSAYPAATVAGLFTNVVFGLLRTYVLLAVVRGRGAVGGYTAGDFVTYAWLTQGLMMTIYVFTWTDLALRIRSGDVAIDLVRPIDVQFAGLAGDYGRAAYHALLRGIPPLLVGVVVFELALPGSALVWLTFLISVALAVLVSYAFRFLYNLVAFWLLDHRGIGFISSLAVNFFSGFVIPTHLFPGWLRILANATPFPAMIQTPIDIFVGAAAGARLALLVLAQAAWAVVLLAAGKAVFGLGTRRTVLQGG